MASLESQVMDQLKAAMLAKEEVAVRSLRAIKAAILQAKTAAGAKDELSEEDEMKLLQKMVKQRKDSLDIFQQQDRTDLAQKEREEIAVIERFLPAQLSDEEVEKAVADIIAETGAKGMADMGKVMGIASQKLAGQADGKKLSMLVKTLLVK